ncbi:MAG: lactonase family protein [Phycisphaerae bacterium]
MMGYHVWCCALASFFVFVLAVSSRAAEGPTTSQPATGPAGTVRMYIGTYMAPKSKGIYTLQLDLASGALTKPEMAGEAVNPSFLALHPSGKYLYAVSEVASFDGLKTGAVSAFAIDGKTFQLRLLNQKASEGIGPCHLIVDRDGKNVLVANYSGGTLAVLPIDSGGMLLLPADIRRHKDQIEAAGKAQPHAHSINLDAAGKFAFAADLGLDRIFIYRYDSATGKLTPADPPAAALPPKSGPRHFAFRPDGKFAYVINETANTVVAFAYDATAGKLTEVQSISTLPAGFKGESFTAEVQVHPSGKFLYGSNRGHDSIAVFAIDAETGKLSSIEYKSTQGKTPRNFGIDPTGAFLVAANQGSGTLVVFRIDAATGKLTPTGSTAEIPAPVCVKFLQAAK